MDRLPTPPEPLPSKSEAPWQTIFWILVNLAINAMAQPGGRICGFASRYRTYLRCSPLICGADMFSIIIRLLTTVFYQRLSFLESLGILLHDRFNHQSQIEEDQRNRDLVLKGEIEDNEGEGIQILERMTWLRWLWFLLGTLPSAIKLLSLSGVGWAQTWGMLFLGSWVINEILIIFATFNQSFFTISREGRISWPGYEQITRSANHKRVQRYLELGEKGLAMTALFMHIVLVNNVFRIMSRPLDGNYSRSPVQMSQNYLRVDHRYISMVTGTVWIPMGFVVFGGFYSILTFIFSLLFFIMLGNMTMNRVAFGIHTLGPTGSFSSFSSLYVWAISTVVISSLLSLAHFLSRRFVVMGRNLLLLYQSGGEGQFRIDYQACLALILFFSTLGTSLFWYGKMYDPSGTSMPIWTGVFG